MNRVILNFLIVGLVFIFGCSEQAETQSQDIRAEEKIITMEIVEEVEDEEPDSAITLSELTKHNSKDDCWIVYEGKVYDYAKAPRHPSMDKTFFRHCGKTSGFEEGAKGKHSGSNQNRVANYGDFIGELEK